MPDFYTGTAGFRVPIIDDNTNADDLFSPQFARGHDPSQYVREMFAAPHGMTLVPESEWDARYDEQEKSQSSLEHVYRRAGWENLDQNGHGYCWAYSTGAAVMLKRSAMGLPYVRLNPHSVAAIIKNGRDEGGWCGLSLKFGRDGGYAVEGNGPGQWPLHSRNTANLTPAVRENMLLHKVTDDWYDLGRPEYGQQLTRQQLATCLFQNNPCPTDFNWWGHSVCSVRFVRVERGSWGLMILNSWKGWGDRGLAVLRGSKAVPDGAVGVVNTLASNS